MITVSDKKFNIYSQKDYDSMTSSLQLHRIKCSCGHAGCLFVHGYYRRTVRSSKGSFRLTVMRLRCSECGRTHAVLHESIVPYSQIHIDDQKAVARAVENSTDRNLICTPEGALDENDVKTIARNYRNKWHEMLLSLTSGGHSRLLMLLEDACTLARACLSNFSMQFMQVRKTENVLFTMTT